MSTTFSGRVRFLLFCGLLSAALIAVGSTAKTQSIHAAEPLGAAAPDEKKVAGEQELDGDADAAENEEPADREHKDLAKKTYDVRAFLRCPLGVMYEQDGRQVQEPDTTPNDVFLGPATPLGGMIERLLLEYSWEPGVNHFAPRPGVLEVTNTKSAHRDVERILTALAAMPAMNPQGRGQGLDRDRCVHICTTSLGDDTELVESVLYDVSDIVQKMSEIQLQTLIEGIDRQTWNDAGGQGSVDYYSAAMAMAVVQTPVVHEKIKNGLAQARGIKRKPPKPSKPVKKIPKTKSGESKQSGSE